MSDPADKLVLTVVQLAFVTGEWAQLAREGDSVSIIKQDKTKQSKKPTKKTVSSLWRGDIIAYTFFLCVLQRKQLKQENSTLFSIDKVI